LAGAEYNASVRALADASKVQRFMEELGRRVRGEGTVYLAGAGGRAGGGRARGHRGRTGDRGRAARPDGGPRLRRLGVAVPPHDAGAPSPRRLYSIPAGVTVYVRGPEQVRPQEADVCRPSRRAGAHTAAATAPMLLWLH